METVETIRPAVEQVAEGNRIRVVWEGAEYRGRFRQTIWDGEARFEGNEIIAAEPINFLNPDRKLERIGNNGLRWQALTTGNFGGFDAIVAKPKEGSLHLQTDLVQCELPLAEIDGQDRVYEAGKMDRRVRVFRMPERNDIRAWKFSAAVKLEPGRDNPIYIVVTQEDGHRAWSSPVWIHRPTA
jgi:hypothetical protein